MKRTITLALALAACAAEYPGDEVASVGVAVTAVGGDGATYTLTTGARVSLTTTAQGGVPNYDVSLDGNAAVVVVKVVPGAYAATLYLDSDPPNTPRAEWPLTRALDGQTDTVNGELVTAQPVMVTVDGGQTANLAFQFKTTGGKIVFGRGAVNVSIDVGQATGYTASAAASGDVAGAPRFAGPYAAGLQAFLPGAGVTNLAIAISGHMTGPWTDTGGNVEPDGQSLGVCAPFHVDSIATGDPATGRLVAEANAAGTAPSFLFGAADICVIDDGTRNQIWLREAREGKATTQAFQDAFAPDNPDAAFYTRVVGDLPDRSVYNSDTGEFNGDLLLGTQTVPMTWQLRIQDDTDFSVWYRANVTGTETFSFSAQ